jgi:glutamine amidotransferase
VIAVVDYGMGNLRSVSKALEHVGARVTVTSNPEEVARAKGLVLPGVGAFKDAVSNLKTLDLWDVILEFLTTGKPFLGICLGLQLLFDVSLEFGETKGFGFIPGSVVAFDKRPGMKIPHMGWNQVFVRKRSSLFQGIKNGEFFYFVHSYYVKPESEDALLAQTEYGVTFPSAVAKGNVFGVQFHPEKSQKAGLKLLENFWNLVKEC